MRLNAASALALAVIALVGSLGCSRSPEAAKARHLERGEKYFAKKDYKDAILEYRNVLRIEPTNAVAIQRLGVAHYQTGALRDAFPFLTKATELEPQNPDVRLKLGTIYLVGNRPDDARSHANAVLDRDAKNFDALLLLADSARTPGDIDNALARLETARPGVEDRPKFHLALGALYLKKRDLARAEQAFKDAVARDPKAVEGHSALGQFYALQQDFGKAEEELKTAATLAPPASPARMQLADFYLRTNRRDAAKSTLTEMTKNDAGFLPAWRRLAEISFGERRYDEALAQLEPVFKKNPSDIEGQVLRGRIRLAKHQVTDAIADFQNALKLEPKLAPARFYLAGAQLEAGNIQQAKAELKDVTTANPNFADARLLLAQVNMQTGSVQPAIEDMEDLARKFPKLPAAHHMLGTAYLVKRDGARAAESFRTFTSLVPKDPRGPYSLGLALAMQGKRPEAAKQFQGALTLAPAFVEPLAQLVSLKFAEKDGAGAVELVKKQMAATPKSGPLHDLLGRAYLAHGNRAEAEKAFLKAVELEPRLVGAYAQLAAIYAQDKNFDQAIARLDQAQKLQPKNPTPLILLANVYERKGDVPKAQQAYEQALAINPKLVPAANNLAYLLSEHGGDKERALQLAQTAKEGAPDDPHVSDTLGWVLYKRGVYQRALTLLQDSAAKLPENPTIQYHLGMTYTKVGNKDAAKKALLAAATSTRPFAEQAEAKRALAELN